MKLVYNGVLNIHDSWKDNGKTIILCHKFLFVIINKFTSKFERQLNNIYFTNWTKDPTVGTNFHNDGYFIVKKLYCKFNDSVSKFL